MAKPVGRPRRKTKGISKHCTIDEDLYTKLQECPNASAVVNAALRQYFDKVDQIKMLTKKKV